MLKWIIVVVCFASGEFVDSHVLPTDAKIVTKADCETVRKEMNAILDKDQPQFERFSACVEFKQPAKAKSQIPKGKAT